MAKDSKTSVEQLVWMGMPLQAMPTIMLAAFARGIQVGAETRPGQGQGMGLQTDG